MTTSDKYSMHRCSVCGVFFTGDEFAAWTTATDTFEVKPGAVMPTGPCPECGSACYPFWIPSNEWVETYAEAVKTVKKGLESLSALMKEADAPDDIMQLGGLLHELVVDRLFVLIPQRLNLFVTSPAEESAEDEKEREL